MNRSKVITCIILLFCCNYSFGQASWSFSVWFNLYDNNDSIISRKDYINKNIKLYSHTFGAHTNNSLVFDTLNNAFSFSQHTIVRGSLLVFIKESDTTFIEIQTENMYLPRINLDNKSYQLSMWNNREEFDCYVKMPGKPSHRVCIPRFDLAHYISNTTRNINFENLVEVKLK